MSSQDWALLAICAARGEAVSPVQLQKSLFLLGQHLPNEVGDSYYQFFPYNWGPCSFQIYDDLDVLRVAGYIETVPTGRGWSIYRQSDKGHALADSLRESAPDHLTADLISIREWVTSRDFSTLLRDVYEKYPKYATNSMFTQL